MNTDSYLEELEQLFKSEKINCYTVNASEGIQPHILAYLGNDYQNRERTLKVTPVPQFFAGLPNKPQDTHKQYAQIQFEYSFPFTIHEDHMADVASLLLFINHMIDMPGLEMDELNNKVLYRYVFLTSQVNEEAFLLVSILGTIMMILDLYTEAIEKIASGQKTFNQLLEQILEASKLLNS